MKIKAVLFDLDGTLLPMDLAEFFREYFKLLCKKLAPLGFDDSKKLINAMWMGVDSVNKNDGNRINEEVFWDTFNKYYPNDVSIRDEIMYDFYTNEFQSLKDICGYTPEADKTVKKIKEMGLRVCVATKPIFPEIATISRMKWAGVCPEDFELHTSFDRCKYCKPSGEYYKETADKLGLAPEECLMVGNDVSDDMPAETIGMKVFLLTDCLLNKENKDISKYAKGSFGDLLEYINTLI